jgi:hypothetical protein
MPALLGDEHAQLRRLHPQLPRKASAREAAAQDCNVVVFGSASIVHDATF